MRLIAEELEAELSPEIADSLLQRTLEARQVDVSDAEQLLSFADGPLRHALCEQVRQARADAMVARIVDVLTPHVRSGIRRRRHESATPLVETSQTPISVGVISGGDTALRQTLVAALGSVGITAVTLGSARTLSATPGASWVDGFVVPSDLPASEARELAWYVARRESACVVVVWPVGEAQVPWASAVSGAVVLGHADAELLGATFVGLVSDQRERGS